MQVDLSVSGRVNVRFPTQSERTSVLVGSLPHDGEKASISLDGQAFRAQDELTFERTHSR